MGLYPFRLQPVANFLLHTAMSVKSYLKGIDLIEVDDPIRPFTTVKSSVIGIVGTAGKGPVNQPVLILNSRRDAEAIFGKNSGDGFTLPAALSDIFDQGAATVVVVNVLDPVLNTVSDELSVTLAPHTGMLPKGFIKTIEEVNNNISLGISRVQIAGIVLVGQCVAVDNSPSITVPVTIASKIVVGMTVEGGGRFSEGTTVISKNGTTVVLSSTADGSGTNTLTFQKDATVFIPSGAANVSIFSPSDTSTQLTRLQINSLAANAQVRMSYQMSLAEGVDYVINYETGSVSRVIDSNKILPRSTLLFGVTRVNDAVAFNTLQNYVIGDAGEKTGMYALLSAQNKVKLTPKIIVATGFTHQKPDALTRSPIVTNLSILIKRLRAVAYVDCPDTNVSDAVAHKSDFDGDKRLVFLYPWFTQLKPNSDGVFISRPMSGFFAGLTARMDNEEGFWNSPSNYPIFGFEGLSREVTFGISDRDSEANYLQMNSIGTVVNLNGWVAWNNFTADGNFISRRRIADMVNESIVYNSAPYADRNITPSRIQNILQATAEYMRNLKQNEAIIGGSVWIDPTLNRKGTLTLGELYVDYDFTTPSPLNTLSFRSHVTGEYYDGIFGNADSAVRITV